MNKKIEDKKIKRSRVVTGMMAILNLKYLKRLLGLFRVEYKDYKWHIALLGFLSFFGGILEGFGVTAVIPIFSFIDKGKADSTDMVSQLIEKFFGFFNLPFTIKFLLIFIVVIFLVKSIVLFLTNYISARITKNYEKKTRGELLNLTLKSDWNYLLKQKIGYLNQILSVDVENSSAMLTYISYILITMANLIIYSLLAFNVSSFIAILTILFGIVIFFVFKPLLYKNKLLSQKVSELYKDIAHYVDEVVLGLKSIKSMHLENQIINYGNKHFEKMRNLNIRMAFLTHLTSALLQPMGIILIIGIFAYAYKLSAFSFASFAVIIYAINKIFINIQAAQGQLNRITTFEPYLSAIVNYKKEANSYKEADIGEKGFSFDKNLEFKNVDFAYKIDKGILHNISFSIEKGEMLGIIGPSGAGKTTITDLLLRLFNPDKGDILLDNIPIKNIRLSEWRRKIGYVSQDAFLINDTIENNIKFYNDKISHDSIIKASKMANIYDFIENLPDKFDTIVGERGMILSGGQRQRIILARVLATNPEILILDEATSALDNESEMLIQKAIENFKGSVTVIAIAHRLSTIMSADNILSIDSGKIIEKGEPDKLLKNSNSYLYKVYNLKE